MRTVVAAAAVGIGLVVVAPAATTSAQTECGPWQFADYHMQGEFELPSTFAGEPFELSQDYPTVEPDFATDEYDWLDVDVTDLDATTDGDAALRYLEAVRDYVYRDNLDRAWTPDPADPSWFHAPWLDAGGNGREYVHGLTHELDIVPSQLGGVDDGDKRYSTWAVAAYNDRGAFGFGQVWCDPDAPDIDALQRDPEQANSFLDGTVVWKLLFTTASPSDPNMSYLDGTVVWDADIWIDNDHLADPPKDRPRLHTIDEVGAVRLIQMDVAVRDDRLPYGWAFGTFTYSAGWDGDTPWERMAPVGLQWGNDPGVTPPRIADGSRTLRQSWIDERVADRSLFPGNHLGWGGRLAGPVDNQGSSCMSCHQTSGSPQAPVLPETPDGRTLTDGVRLAWFVNVPAGVPFGDPDRISTDYSLQMSMGFQNWMTATCSDAAVIESESARGDSVTPPSDVARETCDRLADDFERFDRAQATLAGTSGPSSSLSAWTWLLIASGIGIVLLVPWLIPGKRRPAVDHHHPHPAEEHR